MKKIISFVLGMMLSSQFALANISDGLKQAIDEFHYAMTVEWDQQDQAFAQEQQLKFQTTIEKLVADGLTLDQLKAAFNEKSQLSIDQIMNEIIERNMTDSHEVQKYIQQRLLSNYAKGASWTGEEIAGAIAVVLFFSAMGWLAFTLVTCGNDGRPAC